MLHRISHSNIFMHMREKKYFNQYLIRVFVLILITAAISGCSFLIKMGRAPQNKGTEMKGDVAAGTAAAQKVLQDKGYIIETKSILKGAGYNGRKVEGFKESSESLKSVGKQVAGGMALGMLGVRSGPIKAGDGELITAEISNKWDEDYKAGVPNIIIVALSGGMCDRDINGKYMNCQQLNDYDLMMITDSIQSRLAEYQSLNATHAPEVASKPAVATAAAPAVIPGEAEYQASLARYAAGDYDGAWTQAYASAQVNPSHAGAWQMIGNCQYAKGDKTGAVVSYRQSLALNPDNPQLSAFVNQLDGK